MQKDRRRNLLIFILVIFVAMGLRTWNLGLRPIHLDESVSGVTVDLSLPKLGYYHYNPKNFHGPLHFYLLYLAKILFGHQVWALRLSSALFGIGVVSLPFFFRALLGDAVAIVFSLFLAVSPGMVFYARDAIHETGFLFFSIVLLFAIPVLSTGRSRAGLALFSAGLAGMVVMKETWIIHFAVLLLGSYLFYFKKGELPIPRFSQLIIPLFGFVLTVLALYTGFFRNLPGTLDFFSSFRIWAQRSVEDPRFFKPWYYWLNIFVKDEPVTIFGMGFACVCLMDRKTLPFYRFISFYGLGTFIIYSVLPYKTPWCAIDMVWPFQLLAANYLCERVRDRRLIVSALLIATAISAWQMVSLCFFRYANRTEPYVMNQTTDETVLISNHVLKAAEQNPDLLKLPIGLFVKTPWPFPWILESFTVMKFDPKTKSQDLDGVFLVSSEVNRQNVEARLHHAYYVKKFEMDTFQGQMYAYFDAQEFSGKLDSLKDLTLFVPASTDMRFRMVPTH